MADDPEALQQLVGRLLEYCSSETWKETVDGFLDKNCAVFTNDEEQKFEYMTLFQEFSVLFEAQLEGSNPEYFFPTYHTNELFFL